MEFVMKVTRVANQRSQARVRTGAASVQIDISQQIAKASTYLNRTRSEFAANAVRAKRQLTEPESGVLAGPIAHRQRC
jgi:hypothetical protein